MSSGLLSQPLEVVIVGAGERNELYASFQKVRPDLLKIVGVVDPNKVRRRIFSKEYEIPSENCFENIDQLLSLEDRLGDAAINGTMDQLHVSTSIPFQFVKDSPNDVKAGKI